MRVAIYVRVSTPRQAQTQTIDQQLDRRRAAVASRGWPLPDDPIFRDDGYSGSSLRRPGLDRLRDLAALARLDVILVTDPDRLARNYVHPVPRPRSIGYGRVSLHRSSPGPEGRQRLSYHLDHFLGNTPVPEKQGVTSH